MTIIRPANTGKAKAKKLTKANGWLLLANVNVGLEVTADKQKGYSSLKQLSVSLVKY